MASSIPIGRLFSGINLAEKTLLSSAYWLERVTGPRPPSEILPLFSHHYSKHSRVYSTNTVATVAPRTEKVMFIFIAFDSLLIMNMLIYVYNEHVDFFTKGKCLSGLYTESPLGEGAVSTF